MKDKLFWEKFAELDRQAKEGKDVRNFTPVNIYLYKVMRNRIMEVGLEEYYFLTSSLRPTSNEKETLICTIVAKDSELPHRIFYVGESIVDIVLQLERGAEAYRKKAKNGLRKHYSLIELAKKIKRTVKV